MNENTTNPFLVKNYNTPHNTLPFNLIGIEHYEPAIEEGIKEEMDEINRIIENTEKPDFENTIAALDKSGETLEKVTNMLGNMLNAESTDELQELAQKVMPRLTEHSNNISLNEKLFERVKAVKDNAENENLNGEQKMLVDKYYKSFVRNGALLDEKQKEQYRQLTEQLSLLTLTFEQNSLKDKNDFTLHITDSSQIEGLPEGLISMAAANASANGMEGWLFTLDAPCYVPFMKYCRNRELRKEMYMGYNTVSNRDNIYNNSEIVRHIANLRIEVANLLGYKTYADYVLDNRMAENSGNVYNLLNKLKDSYMPVAEKETETIAALASERDGITDLMPWDWSYYSEILRKEKYDFDEEKLREYFELDKVIEGVFGLATRLYGITFRESTEIPVYHKDVRSFEVFDENGEYLAVLYTDFYPRPTKQSGAWMTEFKGQWMENGKDSRPHVSLVMNFNPPTDGKPALLNHSELNTFLHEFGHALHGMLSKVTYRSLSGTSVYRDFVELPSQIMENFAVEKDFLNTFARHYITGEVMPESEIAKIKAAENFNAGYACIRQVSFGLLDMAWHTLTEDFTGNVEEFEKEAFKPVSLMPQIAGTCMSTQFGHIFSGGYAAGYYGYKWAEVLDADAFSVFKENGIFDKATAASFRNNILSKGGSEHPMDLYIRFRGKKPTIDALLKRNGII